MQAEGTVVRREGDNAIVKVVRSGGCGRCHEIGGCGGDGHEQRCEEFFVDNVFGAQDGQRVTIEIPEGVALKAAVLMYGIPLLALLGGAALARLLSSSDLAVATGGGVCLILAALALRLTRNSDLARRSRVRITGVLPA